MRISGALLILGMISLLTACGPAHQSAGPSVMRGSTGYFDKDGVDYVHGGDPFVEQRMADQARAQGRTENGVWPEAPTTPPAAGQATPAGKASTTTKAVPTPTTPAVAAVPPKSALTDRVREFQIKRFNAGTVRQAMRFGVDSYELKVFFKDQSPVTISGKFKKIAGKLHFEKSGDGYKLTGDLTDAPERVTGDLFLTDLKTQDVIEISYRAFKASLTVHEDLDNPIVAGSDLEKQIADLKKGTFAWVNNWTVLNGPSFYLNDLIKTVDSGTGLVAAQYAFAGESKRTAGETEAYEWNAQSLTKDSLPEVKLIGNSDQGSGRAFQVTLQDKSTHQKSEVNVDIMPEQPDESLPVAAEDVPDVDSSAPAPEATEPAPAVAETAPTAILPTVNPGARTTTKAPTGTVAAAKSPAATPTVAKVPPKAPPAASPRPAAPVISGDAYIPVNMNQTRTAKMHNSYMNNLNLPHVQAMIANFQKGERRRLQDFFDYAYPFRAMMQAVSEYFDVNPMYLYLTADESKYFFGKQYEIETGDGGRALGPFQMHVPAATESHVLASEAKRDNDERRFVTTSACGGARYMIANTDPYKNGDMTIGIAGYNQGAGGARTLVRRYGYTWKQIDYLGARTSTAVLNYVNSKLAIYIIANYRTYYKFPLTSRETRGSYPTNGTVVPPAGIKDATCRAVMAKFL